MRLARPKPPLLALLLATGAALAQEAPPPAAPAPAPGEAGLRPGLFAVGPFWVTPRLRLGTLGVDTNVVYTATDRRTDFVASGGPGLDVALPGRPLRLDLSGWLDYLYFARTASERRLTGEARARLGLTAQRLRAGLEQGYRERFDRPSAEVDERVPRTEWATRADLELDLSRRLGLRTQLGSESSDVEGQPEFAGAQLDATLTRRTRRGLLGLSCKVASKTALLAEGELQEDRFPAEPARDTRGQRLAAGFGLESSTRLEARALVGRRWLRPLEDTSLPSEQRDYADLQLAWHFGPRTRLRLLFLNDVGFSTFDVEGRLPLLDQTSLELRLERAFGRGFELAAFARRLDLTTAGAITVVAADGTAQTAPRDDRVREGGLTLTQLFRRHWRAGFTAAWSSRASAFDDLGVAGLLLGGTLTYVP
jgi:hypothetical protein